MRIFVIFLLCAILCAFTSRAALVSLDGIVTSSADPLNSVEEFTIDILIDLVDLSTAPAGSKYIIFESGGDGNGVAIWLDVDAEELVFYQDRGDFTTSTPAEDTAYSLGVSTFSDTQIVIRLQNDYSGPVDTSTLTVTDGITTISSGTQTLLGDDVDGVGPNNTGLGTIAGGIAGADENGFTYTNYAIPPGGSLELVAYDTASPTEPPPMNMPTPDSFPLPEPSSLLLVLCGYGALLRRQRF